MPTAYELADQYMPEYTSHRPEECDRCNGRGLISITIGGDGYGDRCCGTMDCDDQPCPECNPNYNHYWRDAQ